MPDLPKKLAKKLERRLADNALRSLSVDKDLVDFSSNDYLGFSRELWILKRAQEILGSDDFENGATGSRLLTGNHSLYDLLETQLTNFHASEAALVFNSGYDANLGFFSAVPQRGDYVFYDELVHASIRDGIKLGNAKAYKFKHNDISDLKSKLLSFGLKTTEAVIYVVTESVFSMDGDSPDLVALANFCAENNYCLVVDEAHAVGVFDAGLCQQFEIEKLVFARIVTFGKALGSHGAAILGSIILKQYLVNFARSLIYTTALPPHTVATISAAYDFLNFKGNSNRELLFQNISYFKEQLVEQVLQDGFIESNSAIQCATIKGNKKVKVVAKELRKKGFDIKPIRSPTVPEGEERLRFCLHAFNTKEEIKEVVQLLKKYR